MIKKETIVIRRLVASGSFDKEQATKRIENCQVMILPVVKGVFDLQNILTELYQIPEIGNYMDNHQLSNKKITCNDAYEMIIGEKDTVVILNPMMAA